MSQKTPTKPERQSESDLRDTRGRAYDPVTAYGLPQPDQAKEVRTKHQDAQSGADVRSVPLPSEAAAPLPEGLRRERKGPLGSTTGRRHKEA